MASIVRPPLYLASLPCLICISNPRKDSTAPLSDALTRDGDFIAARKLADNLLDGSLGLFLILSLTLYLVAFAFLIRVNDLSVV
jgi:hypothetical protein